MKIEKKLEGIKNENWIRKAKERQKNRGWLKYAYKISIRIQSAIEDKKNFSQKDLAVLVGVSPQYISKVIKGQENLTLETIYKLSSNLGVELITFPEFKYSIPYYPSRPSFVQKDFQEIVFKGVVDETSANVDNFALVYNCQQCDLT